MTKAEPSKLVVVIDDDAAVRRGVERLLNVSGFGTETFASAEAFLKSGTTRDVFCLVLDIRLGGMSGIELRREMAARGSLVPVVFMTAGNDEHTRKMAAQVGCVAFLQKPFEASTLLNALSAASPRGSPRPHWGDP